MKAEALAANVGEVLPYLATRGLSPEVAEVFQLGYRDDNRLSIPYVTNNGVVQIKYRCLNTAHEIDGKHTCSAKYIGEAGCGTHLYNAGVLIGASDLVVLTEGEMDAITVQAACAIPAVAYPGVKNWKPYYRLCFEGVSEVVVVADGEDVGRDTAGRIAEKLGVSARVLDLGDGMDANRFITEYGATAFTERLMS